MRPWWGSWWCGLLGFGLASGPVVAGDAKVPAGRDPGGVGVAIVGSGVDYTKPTLAGLLARDGEGEAIAWDFVDDDRTPLARTGDDDGLAVIVANSGARVRLVIVRTVPDIVAMLAPALQFAAQTPARIALVVPVLREPMRRADLDDAARRLPGLLLVVPSRLVVGGSVAPVAGGAVVVAESGGGGQGVEGGHDLSVLIGAAPGSPAERAVRGGRAADDVAAAMVAARAAQLIAAEPGLGAGEIKARLLRPPPGRP